ncbi:DUF305 domain-containing protein [soil metagenome]
MISTSTHRAHPWRRRTALAAALLATATASACGSTSDDATETPAAVRTASDGSSFNQADIDFATQMIPHHAQAVQMVVMAQGRELDPPVAALMEQIRAAQVPEIETMSDWLDAWGEPVPATSLDHANAGEDMDDLSSGMDDADMGDMGDMPGMMSGDQMAALEDSSDAGFQSMWLEMMVSHHEGAIEMARVEIEDGANADAIALAKAIIESQSAEIDSMDSMLES